MALYFIDGFDHYATADIIKKWSEVQTANGASISIDTAIKNTGTSSMRIYSNYRDKYYSRLLKNLGSNLSTIAAGFWFRLGSAYYGKFFEFRDGSAAQVVVGCNSAGNILVYNGSTLIATSDDAGLITVGEPVYLAVKVVFHSTAGSVEVKVDGVTKISLSGIDTIATANAYANIICFYCYYGVGLFHIDDLYVADDFQGTCVVDTILPDGAGDSTVWTPSAGSNYQCVDESPMSNTDYVSSTNPGDIDNYSFGNINIASPVSVKGVQIGVYAHKDEEGSRKIATIIKPSTTNIAGDAQEISTSNAGYLQVYALNHATSAAWSESEVNSCKFGVKLVT